MYATYFRTLGDMPAGGHLYLEKCQLNLVSGLNEIGGCVQETARNSARQEVRFVSK